MSVFVLVSLKFYHDLSGFFVHLKQNFIFDISGFEP